jgi:hypothetical protein
MAFGGWKRGKTTIIPQRKLAKVRKAEDHSSLLFSFLPSVVWAFARTGEE